MSAITYHRVLWEIKANKFKGDICFIFPEFIIPPGHADPLSLGHYVSSV